jgi:hypothetical protein
MSLPQPKPNAALRQVQVNGPGDAGGPGRVRSIGKLRSMVQEMLAEELGQIDELVEPMLRAGAQ